ncbi:MAG TPA: hypothetical protein VE262_12785 [Blastocatellia bacterium]|nr:hypothetical protein [Blastocatellia bacterium]
MALALALVFIAIAGGTLATYLYDESSTPAARVCAGACLGLTALGVAGFFFAAAAGFTYASLLLASAVTLSPLALLLARSYRARAQSDALTLFQSARRIASEPTRRDVVYFALYAFVAVVLYMLFDRTMFERDDGMYTGVANNYGDLPFHISVITRFVYGQNFPPEAPMYAGARFTYPFVPDFITAMLVRAGAGLERAAFIQNMIVGLALVGLLHNWALALTRDRAAALITPALVLLSGGFGWLLLFQEARATELGVFPLLTQLIQDYTIRPGSTWRWGNTLTALLVPQRSIMLGLPLALVIFTQWWEAIGLKGEPAHSASMPASTPESTSVSARRMAGAGAIAGLLPLVHAHTFAVVVGMAFCLALIFRGWRAWAAFFAVAFVISAPQTLYVMRGSHLDAQSFLGWHIGWDRGEENIFWFWLKNTGLFIPLLVTAAFWKNGGRLVERKLLLFYLPFTLCFLVPNLVRLAPWVWDNIKVLIYWFVASSPLVALLVARLWRRGAWPRRAATLLLITLTLAGSLDVWRVLSRAQEYMIFDREGIIFAEMIRRTAPPRAVILHATIPNHPVHLSGGRSLMGYPGHVWSHGIDYRDRAADIRRIYNGEPSAEGLLAFYHIEYVVVSPLEAAEMPVSEEFFERFAKVGETGEYRLYKIAEP